MAYKKPQIVAKSAAKQSFVAGCPTNATHGIGAFSDACGMYNKQCQIASTK